MAGIVKTVTKKKDANDVTELNKIWIPTYLIKLKVEELQKNGYTNIPLGDFILILRDIVRSQKEV